MKEPNNPNDIHNKVSMYLDGALNEEDQDNLLRSVAEDPNISRMYNREKSFRDLIRSNVKRPIVSQEFIQTIKDNIKKD
ncbi:MAG: hypothetical protein ABIV51_05325 [Saprospiraceae bacterium]